MAQARRKKITTGNGLSTQVQHGLREGAMLILSAVSLFLLFALVTYHADDPGWSHTGPRDDIQNYTGVVGAWIADVLYSVFGYLSYLFPVIIAFSGWLVLKGSREHEKLVSPDDIDYQTFVIRWSGFFLTLAAGCAITSLHFVIEEL